MKVYMVVMKKSSDEEIINQFVFGEKIGWGDARLDREFFHTKEEAEAEKTKRDDKYLANICVAEANISVEKLL